MQSHVILSGWPYRLVSYGKGLAYELQNWGNDEKPERLALVLFLLLV